MNSAEETPAPGVGESPGARANAGVRRGRIASVPWGLGLLSLGWFSAWFAACLCLTPPALRDWTPSRWLGVGVLSYLSFWGWAFAVQSAQRRVRLMGFAVTTFFFGLGLAVLELPTILFGTDYRIVFGLPQAPWYKPNFRADPELLFARVPNTRETWSHVGGELSRLGGSGDATTYEYEVAFDDNGYRNAVTPVKADIAVVGDSFIEGARLNLNEILTAHLADAAGANVANLGISAYGPEQERFVIKRHALPLHPKIVVWAFFEGNDFRDLQLYQDYRILYQRYADGSDQRFAERGFTRNALVLWGRWMGALADRLSGAAATDADSARAATSRNGVFTNADGTKTTIGFLYPGAPLRGPELVGLERMRELYAEIGAVCRDQNIQLVVMFIPDKFRVLGPSCDFPPDSVCRHWIVNDLPDRLRELIRVHAPSARFVDLTPALRKATAAGTLVYFPDDTHWNAAGHRIAADALANALVKP